MPQEQSKSLQKRTTFNAYLSYIEPQPLIQFTTHGAATLRKDAPKTAQEK